MDEQDKWISDKKELEDEIKQYEDEIAARKSQVEELNSSIDVLTDGKPDINSMVRYSIFRNFLILSFF